MALREGARRSIRRFIAITVRIQWLMHHAHRCSPNRATISLRHADLDVPAASRGVLPSLLRNDGSAPRWRSSLAIARLPADAAICRAVTPWSYRETHMRRIRSKERRDRGPWHLSRSRLTFVSSMIAPESRRIRTHPSLPDATAPIRAVGVKGCDHAYTIRVSAPSNWLLWRRRYAGATSAAAAEAYRRRRRGRLHEALRTSQLSLVPFACQLTLPPRPISCLSSASFPFAAANHKASPIESLIASAAP